MVTKNQKVGEVSTAAIADWLAPWLPRWTRPQIARWLSERAHERAMCLVSQHGLPVALGVVREENDGGLHVECVVGDQALTWFLVNYLNQRWPDWRRRRLTMVRRGKVKPVSVRLIERFVVLLPGGG